METKPEKNTIIAFVGKGGVGKTSLSALTVRVLSETYPDKRILAIDADPAVGLSTALGVDVGMTVDDIRKEFIESSKEGETRQAIELLGDARYQMLDSLVEMGNISFLAIGRPEAAGCYCKVNSYLKAVIGLIAENFDYVVIDGEAGIEQVNRRVMEKVTHLILVSDPSRKGIQVVNTIRNVAKNLVMFEKSQMVLNRVPDEVVEDLRTDEELCQAVCICDDRAMCLNDMRGKSVFGLPQDSVVVEGVREALRKLAIL